MIVLMGGDLLSSLSKSFDNDFGDLGMSSSNNLLLKKLKSSGFKTSYTKDGKRILVNLVASDWSTETVNDWVL